MKACKLTILDEVNVKIDNLAIDVRRRLVNEFKYEIPYAKHTPQYKLGRWDGTKGFFGLGGNGFINQLDRILPILEEYDYTITEIEDLRGKYDIKFDPIQEDFWGDKTWPVGHVFEGQPIRLKDYQVKAVNTYLENLQSLQSISTGSGKTILTATLSKIIEPYGRSIIIVPNKTLVEQTEEDYVNVGLDVGVYFGDRKELNRTHTICTWQSLNILGKKTQTEESYSLAEFLDGVSTVIVDECHVASADVLTKLLNNNFKNTPIRWGMTGTIPKEDHTFQSLLTSIGPIVGTVTAYELQEKGVLSKCDVNVLQLVDIVAHRNYQDELKYLVTNQPRIEFIADKIKEISKTGNTMVLVDRISTGEMLTNLIDGSTFIKGDVKNSDRKTAFKDINEATNSICIATYGVASTGINIPRIFNLVMIEPGKSFVRVIQSIGRGIRKSKDKDYVQIWDVTSTCKYSKRHLAERKKYYKQAQYPYNVQKVNWE